jgi:hypothetical protein
MKLNWEQVTVNQLHHVLVTIDPNVHVVRSSTADSIPRESWLAVLRQHRPDLIEKDNVTTARHTRHLRSGKNITIDPHGLTVYRRKDKKSKRRMK